MPVLLEIDLDSERVMDDLRLTQKELEQVQGFAVRDSVRTLRGIARKETSARTDLPRASINRRVLSFPKQSRVWLGAARNPLVTSFRATELVPIRRQRTVRGRTRKGKIDRSRKGVVFRGQRLKGVFVPTRGRYRGVPFRERDGGGVEPVGAPVHEEVRQAFDATADRATEVLERSFRASAERAILRRR